MGSNGAGILLLITSNGLTASIDAVAKYLTAALHSIQIVWAYFLVITSLLIGYSLVRRIPLRRTMSTRRAPLQLARSAMLMLTITTLFAALSYIPLADAIALSFMSPLFITALSGPVLGERVGAHRWGAVMVGLCGMLILIRPGSGAIQWGALLALMSAIFYASFQIMTRRLASTEKTFTTLFYTSGGGLLWASLGVYFFWKPLIATHVWIFIGIGALGAAAHLCMIKAFESTQASFLAPFNYFKLVWGVILGYLVFNDLPDSQVVLGSAIIVASGLYTLYAERRFKPA